MSKLYIEPYSRIEIREVRERLGYTQREIGELAGICQNTVSHIECGRNDSVPIRMLLTLILDDLEMKPSKEDSNGSDL